ncbi:hypothetical protein [Candidatus Enterovibrio altilux]
MRYWRGAYGIILYYKVIHIKRAVPFLPPRKRRSFFKLEIIHAI